MSSIRRLNCSNLQLRRLRGPKKGDVYCVLSCEGQVKRTSLAVGHRHPVWEEEVTFRAVQITSDLQVCPPSAMSHQHAGSFTLLPQAVINTRASSPHNKQLAPGLAAIPDDHMPHDTVHGMQ